MRTRPAYKGLLALAFSCFALPAAFALELQLSYAQTEEKDSTAPASPAPAAAKAPLKAKTEPEAPTLQHSSTQGRYLVTLGEGYLRTENPEGTTFYDFATRRRWYQHAGESAWTESSLYCEVDYRIREMINREQVSRALAAGGVTNRQMPFMGDMLENQVLFGLIIPTPNASAQAPELSLAQADAQTLLSSRKEEELGRSHVSTTSVPEALRPAFLAWLAYESHLHPKHRHTLFDTQLVPDALSARYLNMVSRTRLSLTLQSAKLAEGQPNRLSLPPPDHRLPGTPELLALVAATQDQAQRTQAPTTASTQAFADKAVKEGRPLDAFLAFVELGYQTGEDIRPFVGKLRQSLQTDPLCKSYIEGTRARSQQRSHALEVLRGIDRSKLQKAYLIDVIIADILSEDPKSNEAIPLFLDILRHNPFLCGVWHDLGQAYHHRYQIDQAWLCWDTALALVPLHPQLADVQSLEKQMPADFPDFFPKP